MAHRTRRGCRRASAAGSGRSGRRGGRAGSSRPRRSDTRDDPDGGGQSGGRGAASDGGFQNDARGSGRDQSANHPLRRRLRPDPRGQRGSPGRPGPASRIPAQTGAGLSGRFFLPDAALGLVRRYRAEQAPAQRPSGIRDFFVGNDPRERLFARFNLSVASGNYADPSEVRVAWQHEGPLSSHVPPTHRKKSPKKSSI